MKFTVLICTYKRPELLKRALHALIEKTEEKPNEVVIVNGGDAKAGKAAAPFLDHPYIKVKLIRTANKNLAASRNVGLPHCTGDIIAMTDDDAEVFRDWITQMKRAHADHPEAGAVGGAVLGTNTESLVGKAADAITFPSWPDARYARTLPGVNISYKREAVEKIGPQDETLSRGEDVDYNWRLLQLGMKIYFDPAIKVYHHHRPSLGSFLYQHYMYGRSYYLVRRKWPKMYSVYPHGIRRFRDVLKALNFLAAMFYQPFLSVRLLGRWRDRIFGFPLLFLAGLFWKCGMIFQGILSFVQNDKT